MDLEKNTPFIANQYSVSFFYFLKDKLDLVYSAKFYHMYSQTVIESDVFSYPNAALLFQVPKNTALCENQKLIKEKERKKQSVRTTVDQ